jgi:hypothetical protein
MIVGKGKLVRPTQGGGKRSSAAAIRGIATRGVDGSEGLATSGTKQQPSDLLKPEAGYNEVLPSYGLCHPLTSRTGICSALLACVLSAKRV